MGFPEMDARRLLVKPNMHTKLWMMAFALTVAGLAGCTTAPEEAGTPVDDDEGTDVTVGDEPMDPGTTMPDDGTGAGMDDGTGGMGNDTMDDGSMGNASSDNIMVEGADAPESQDTADGGVDTTA